MLDPVKVALNNNPLAKHNFRALFPPTAIEKPRVDTSPVHGKRNPVDHVPSEQRNVTGEATKDQLIWVAVALAGFAFAFYTFK